MMQQNHTNGRLTDRERTPVRLIVLRVLFTLFAAGTGAFLLCTGLELPQTLFEAARGMLVLPDLLTGIGIGLFGLCGLVCAWQACGEETE